MKLNLKDISLLIQNKKFEEAINKLNEFNDEDRKNSNYYFIKGVSYLYLRELENAVENFTLALNFTDNNPTFYFYRGFAYSKLNKFNEAKLDYNKAISLKPSGAEYYNNLAQIYYTTGQNEKAIENFIKSVELNNNFKQSITGLTNVLSQTKNSNINDSKIVLAHNELNKINLQYSSDKYIEDLEIKKLIKVTNNIINKNIKNLEFDIVQTYREQKSAPKCNRHKKIFNTYNAIPQYCFGCYKVQIDVDTVVDLIKLYLVFDRFNFENDNIRKCMIELRPNVSGRYKGLIFCNSIKESELILKKLINLLNINFKKNLKCKIKRGCSEYAIKYPKYDSLKEDAMTYKPEWEKYEKLIDKKYPDLIFNSLTKPTIKGISLFDALVIRNWLAYARMVGDESYKSISDQIFYSKFVEEKLKLKLKVS